MSKSIPGNQKHLIMDDRIFIEKELDSSKSLRSIAAQLGKDPTTISKEIKKHRTFHEHNRYNEPKTKCALFSTCTKKNICQIFAPVWKEPLYNKVLTFKGFDAFRQTLKYRL